MGPGIKQREQVIGGKVYEKDVHDVGSKSDET